MAQLRLLNILKNTSKLNCAWVNILTYGLASSLFGATVTLDVGSNFRDSVNAYPENTIFIIKSGIHRFQTLTAKNGDSFIGEDGSVMTGARTLTDWVKEGNYWAHGGQTQQGTPWGDHACGGTEPDNYLWKDTDLDSIICTLPEDLFMDDIPLQRRSYLNDVTSGRWYFDYGADKVYIADDPAGHVMEISVTNDVAINGAGAADVTVRNLTIEKYASPNHIGCLGGGNPGRGWIIENCVVWGNHGIGIRGNRDFVMRNNRSLWNGQMGVCGSGCALVERNEVAYNNHSNVQEGYEGGGTKFDVYEATDSIKMIGNYVHHNFGHALWCDGGSNSFFIGNIVEYNRGNGLMYEVSNIATIRCNICRFNSFHSYYDQPNLYLSNSGNLNVYDNIVVVGLTIGSGKGVGIWSSDDNRRPEGGLNVNIHHNDITYLFQGGWSGHFAWDFGDQYLNSRNIQFDYNTYHTQSPDYEHFFWKGNLYSDPWGRRTWSEWCSFGFDSHGSLDSDINLDRPLHDACSDCRQNVDFWRSGGNPTIMRGGGTNMAGAAAPSRIAIIYDAAAGAVLVNAGGTEKTKFDIRVYNALGSEVAWLRRSITVHDEMELDVSELGRGVYFIEARGNEEYGIVRIIVAR